MVAPDTAARATEALSSELIRIVIVVAKADLEDQALQWKVCTRAEKGV